MAEKQIFTTERKSKVEKQQAFSVLSGDTADWRIWFGLTVSSSWLIVLSVYISGSIGWKNIGDAPIETLGNFLEGAFAPLAFLWLVIGYFLQQKELSQNTEAIRMQHVEFQNLRNKLSFRRKRSRHQSCTRGESRFSVSPKASKNNSAPY